MPTGTNGHVHCWHYDSNDHRDRCCSCNVLAAGNNPGGGDE